MIRKIAIVLMVALLVGTTILLNKRYHKIDESQLSSQLDKAIQVRDEPVVNCAAIAKQQPIVLLALGQSNAANHGETRNSTGLPVVLIANSKCIMATDPLPGSTGHGGSIWSRLPHYLLPHLRKPLVLSVIGVDATTIADWTEDNSPLRRHLTERIKSMQSLGLPPTLILWQLGEADARLNTTNDVYSAGLDKLKMILDRAGSDAPIVMAYSTRCRSEPHNGIRTAITSKAAHNHRFMVGPDTDALSEVSSRIDGCHFSALGLDLAAQLWATELQIVFASI